jgi:hypothetical protein
MPLDTGQGVHVLDPGNHDRPGGAGADHNIGFAFLYHGDRQRHGAFRLAHYKIHMPEAADTRQIKKRTFFFGKE